MNAIASSFVSAYQPWVNATALPALAPPPGQNLFRVQDEDMENAGIHSGDLLLIETAKPPKHNDLVLARLGKGCRLRRLIQAGGKRLLVAENSRYPALEWRPGQVDLVLGVAVCV